MSRSGGSVENVLLLSIPADHLNVQSPGNKGENASDESEDNGIFYVINDMLSAKVRNSLGNMNLSSSIKSSVNSEASKTIRQYDTNKNTNVLYARSRFVDSVVAGGQEPDVSSSRKVSRRRCPLTLPGSPSKTIKSFFRSSVSSVKNEYGDDLLDYAADIEDESGNNSGTCSPDPFTNYPKRRIAGNKMNIRTVENMEKKELRLRAGECLIKANTREGKNVPSILTNTKTEETKHIMNRLLRDDMERVNSIKLAGNPDIDNSLDINLQQVDSLLDEMENVQSEIEKKLKNCGQNAHIENDTCTRKLTCESGDFTGSTPNLNFNTPESYSSPEPRQTKSDKPKNTIIEESCLKETFPFFKDEVKNEVSPQNDTKPGIVPESKSTFSVRNLGGSKVCQPSVVSDSRDLSESSPNNFAKTSAFGLINRNLPSPKRRTQQYSSPKEQSTGLIHEYHNEQNNVYESRYLSGIDIEPRVLEKSCNSYPNTTFISYDLLSLPVLWKEDKATNTKNPDNLKHQLDEEQYRRQMSLTVRLETFTSLFPCTEKRLLDEVYQELKKTQKRVSDLETELGVLKDKKEIVTIQFMEERKRVTMLEQQNAVMQQTLTVAKENEKAAVEKVQSLEERLKITRNEQREFYQTQLKTGIDKKVNELKDQLESEKVTLKIELQMKEKQLTEKAMNQCRVFADRCKEKVSKLDEKFRNEIQILETKLAESEEKRRNAETLLKEETKRRTEIAGKLGSVMETQWQETMKIITNAAYQGGQNKMNDINAHCKRRAKN